MASSSTSATRRKTIQANVRLRFRPAESKLAQQLRDAATQLDQGTASAHSVAATIRQATTDAIPQITQAVAGQQKLSDQLRAVAPALDPNSGFGKAAAIETQGAARRLGELKTNAITDFIGQRARAAAGEAYQVSNLRAKHDATVERIGQQAVDLKAQEGDYAASLAGKYADADLARAFSRAQQQRSFNHSDAAAQRAADRAAAKQRKQAKKDAHVTPAQQGALEDAVTSASTTIAPYVKTGADAATIRKLFLTDTPAVPAHFDPDKYAALLKKDPTMDKTVARAKATTPALPGHSKIPTLPLLIAIDLAIHHRLTAPTIAKLHARKYRAGGWPTKAPAAPRPAPLSRTPAPAPAGHNPFG